MKAIESYSGIKRPQNGQESCPTATVLRCKIQEGGSKLFSGGNQGKSPVLERECYAKNKTRLA